MSLRVLGVGGLVCLAAGVFGCKTVSSRSGVASTESGQPQPGRGGPAAPVAQTASVLFTMTNAPSGNEILAFTRAADGSLTAAGRLATGGNGTSEAFFLDTENALIETQDGQFLLGVNTGSDSVAVVRVNGTSLTLTDTAAIPGGRQPVSVAEFRNLVYVLVRNPGNTEAVIGFRLQNGKLTAIPNATAQLSGSEVRGSEVAFTPDGSALIVPETRRNTVNTFAVNQASGALGSRVVTNLPGAPLGFAITQPDSGGTPFVVISELNGFVTSHALGQTGGLVGGTLAVTSQSPNIRNGFRSFGAPCWLALTPSVSDASGKKTVYVYTANAAPGFISSFRLDDGGAATVVKGDAANTGGASVDIAVDPSGDHVYVIDGGNPETASGSTRGAGSLTVFARASDGSLQRTSSVVVPFTALGLVVR